MNNDEILEEGDIITSVNAIKIKNIEDYRKGLSKSNKFVVFKTMGDKECVVSLKELIDNEAYFSETFKYPVSISYKKLS